jgi:Ca-activated chloride channel family protein
MSFLVGWRLWFLLGVAGLAFGWIVVMRQRQRHVVRFTNVDLLDVVAPQRPDWRRHVPPILFVLALAALVIGFARPVRPMKEADERATIVLAIDTSLSMEATDVDPNRLEVARAAAEDFVDQLPEEISLGLVTFNGVATVAVAPTEDRAAMRAALDNMALHESTAIGEAIFTALDSIATVPPGADGQTAPGRIVLMSDGETTVGRPDADAAAAAAEAGVPVFTIAFGTDAGVIVTPDSLRTPVPVQPEPLREIAETTGGQAYEAESLPELDDVYQDIGSVVGFKDVDRDISGWFVGLGLLLVASAGTGSLAWSQRLP